MAGNKRNTCLYTGEFPNGNVHLGFEWKKRNIVFLLIIVFC